MFKRLFNKYFLRPNIKNCGENNIIEISDKVYLRRVKINIYGNNNKIIIDDGDYLHNSVINIGFSDTPINNCLVRIGKNTGANGMTIQLGESDSNVIIGDNCMISFNVEISCTDTHSIVDLDGNLLNCGNSIEIGSHVWVCKNVVVLKNTKVCDNSIIAQRSVVTKNFEQNNIIIAGNPAKIVKENINWTFERPEKYKLEK